MDFPIQLPVRLAASASREETTATPETPDPPSAAGDVVPGPLPSADSQNPNEFSPNSLIVENDADGSTYYVPVLLSPDLNVQAATGPSNHQFWLKDAKIAEELFTIHRSAQDLLNFTASIIGNQDPAMGYRPIPVMSDGDVLFMTQLSSDIVRSVNGLTGIRQHSTRMRRRRIKHGHAAPPKEYPAHQSHASRENTVASAGRSRENTAASGAGGKRSRKTTEDDQLQQCYKCGRKETPEWRKGPDGLLCNSCGLVYVKQRRRQRMADKADKGQQAGVR